MRSALLSLDIYGAEPSLFINRKDSHKTCLGVIVTFITVILSVGTFILFGQDFFFKLNPSVVTEEKLEETPPIIYPTTDTFTIFFELIDLGGHPIDPNKLKTQFVTTYAYITRDENDKYQSVLNETSGPKPCSETKAVDNPDLDPVRLENAYCLDWEDLSAKLGRPVPLGGFLGDDEVSIFRIEVRNMAPNGEISSYKDIKDEISSRIAFKTTYPSFVFDVNSADNPIKKTYESFIYNLDADMRRIDRHFFEVGTLEDDVGWMFKDVVIHRTVKQDRYETELSVISESDETTRRVEFYNFLGYLGKKNVIFRRKYMKIQEVAALAGGFIKILHLILGFWMQMYARFSMVNYIMEFSKSSKTKLSLVSFQSSNNQSRSNIRNNNNLQAKGEQRKRLSYAGYLLGKCRLNKSEEFSKFAEEAAKVNEKLDLVFLVHFFSSLKSFMAKNLLASHNTKVFEELDSAFSI